MGKYLSQAAGASLQLIGCNAVQDFRHAGDVGFKVVRYAVDGHVGGDAQIMRNQSNSVWDLAQSLGNLSDATDGFVFVHGFAFLVAR